MFLLNRATRPTDCADASGPLWGVGADQVLMIEVLVSSATDANRKQGLVAALVEKLGEAGIDPNDIIVFFLETDRAFGGGRFAPPVAFA